MSEERQEKAQPPDGPISSTESPGLAPGSEAGHPTFLCEACGIEKPAEQVYSCTLCTLTYCVKHLAPMAHYCFGALGKPQSIGVSG